MSIFGIFTFVYIYFQGNDKEKNKKYYEIILKKKRKT